MTATPYDGTIGWSGSTTSRDRAEREAEDGTSIARTDACLGLMRRGGRTGTTAREAAALLGLNHGQVSAALTALHKTGRAARIAEPRGQHQPYVLPEHVDDRPTEPYRRHSPNKQMEAQVERVRALLDLRRAVTPGELERALYGGQE